MLSRFATLSLWIGRADRLASNRWGASPFTVDYTHSTQIESGCIQSLFNYYYYDCVHLFSYIEYIYDILDGAKVTGNEYVLYTYVCACASSMCDYDWIY